MTLFPHPFDPRTAVLITQWLFMLMLGLSLLAVAIVDVTQLMTASASTGLALAVVTTAAMTIWRPALVPSRPLFYLVPIIDGLAIAVLRLQSEGGDSLAPLLALIVPATWLGTSGRAWSVLIALLLGGLALTGDIARGLSGETGVLDSDLPALLMVPVIATVASLFGFQLVDEAESATTSERLTRRTRDAIVDTVDVGMIVLDGSGSPIIVNRALREHPVVRAVGPNPYDAVRSIPSFEADGHTRHTPEREPLMRAMTEEGLTDQLFWARAHDDAAAYAFLANSRRLIDEAGQWEATVMVFTDVTQYLDALRSRDRLISSVSHELRTPLTVMRGFLELAKEAHAGGDGDLAEYLEVIERNLTREFAIVDQLILAAEIGDDVTAVSQPAATNLGACTEQAVEAFRAEANAKAIDMRCSSPSAQVMMDPRLFRLIAEALLANAVRFTPRHGQVTADARHEVATDEHAEQIRLTVSDSGMGISAKDLERVFDPFFRTEAALRAGAPGVGLGLPVLKRILDSHDGVIHVDSAPGRGTTVVVELPVGEMSGDGGI